MTIKPLRDGILNFGRSINITIRRPTAYMNNTTRNTTISFHQLIITDEGMKLTYISTSKFQDLTNLWCQLNKMQQSSWNIGCSMWYEGTCEFGWKHTKNTQNLKIKPALTISLPESEQTNYWGVFRTQFYICNRAFLQK